MHPSGIAAKVHNRNLKQQRSRWRNTENKTETVEHNCSSKRNTNGVFTGNRGVIGYCPVTLFCYVPYSVKKCFLTFHPTSCLGHGARPGRWLTGYMMRSRMYRTNTSAPYNSPLPPPLPSSPSSLAAGWTMRKLNRKSCARCFVCGLVKRVGCFPLTFSVWVQVGGLLSFIAASIPLLQEFRLQDGVRAAHFKYCCIKFGID